MVPKAFNMVQLMETHNKFLSFDKRTIKNPQILLMLLINKSILKHKESIKQTNSSQFHPKVLNIFKITRKWVCLIDKPFAKQDKLAIQSKRKHKTIQFTSTIFKKN